MFNIDITADYIIIKQFEYEIKLRDNEIMKIITTSDQKVDLSQEVSFFRRDSGNITFVFFKTDEYGIRKPTLARIDINKQIWGDILNRRTFLHAPKTKNGICTLCGIRDNLPFHYNCAKYGKTLQLFLQTPDGKTCLYILCKMISHIYTSSKVCHIRNIELDLLMHLHMDITHKTFNVVYDKLIQRNDHAFACATNFNYFLKICSPLICEKTLDILTKSNLLF